MGELQQEDLGEPGEAGEKGAWMRGRLRGRDARLLRLSSRSTGAELKRCWVFSKVSPWSAVPPGPQGLWHKGPEGLGR